MTTGFPTKVGLMLGVFAAGLLPGCALGVDVLNPALLSGLGFDPNAFAPAPGVTVVTFTNSTTQFVEFNIFVAQDANDFGAGVRDITNTAPAGEQATEPLRCPVGLITPGEADDNLNPTTAGALVGGEGGTVVEYTGGPLVAGVDFGCGDVIEIELLEIVGADGNPGFTYRIRVLPGR